MNCYEQITLLRELIVESGDAAHWKTFELLGRLNAAQRRLCLYIGMQPGGWLIKRTTVTPSDGEISFPSDCSKPVYLEEVSSGKPISFGVTVMDRRMGRVTGTSLYTGFTEAYFTQNTIVVNQSGYAESCYLWYLLRVPDLHLGTASAGAATSITLSSFDGINEEEGFGAKIIADYYNDVPIHLLSGTGAPATDTITDYTTGRVATVTGTYAKGTTYATVSRLPEECHELMYHEAALAALSKPAAAADPKYFEYLEAIVRELKIEFATWISSSHVGTDRVRITEYE